MATPQALPSADAAERRLLLEAFIEERVVRKTGNKTSRNPFQMRQRLTCENFFRYAVGAPPPLVLPRLVADSVSCAGRVSR